MVDIHDRMPMILSVEDEKKWLDQNQSLEDLKVMLLPFPVEQMRAYPVSKDVGNVKNQKPELYLEACGKNYFRANRRCGEYNYFI